MSKDTLDIAWYGPDGQRWALTGEGGVYLAEDLEGFGHQQIEHVFDHAQRRKSVIRKNLEIHARLEIGKMPYLTGQEYYDLASRWWSLANSPIDMGRLVVTSPSGTQRYANFYLLESPQTKWKNDPGLEGVERETEIWSIRSDDCWWFGDTVATVISDSTGTTGKFPLYDGAYPLNLTPVAVDTKGQIYNLSDNKMYPTLRLIGPMEKPSIDVIYGKDWSLTLGGGDVAKIRMTRDIAAGEIITINTEPWNFYARSNIEQRNVISEMGFNTTRWPYVPTNDGTAIVKVNSTVMGPGAAIEMIGYGMYERPF